MAGSSYSQNWLLAEKSAAGGPPLGLLSIKLELSLVQRLLRARESELRRARTNRRRTKSKARCYIVESSSGAHAGARCSNETISSALWSSKLYAVAEHS